MDRRLFVQVAAALVAAVTNPTTPLLGQGRKPQPAAQGDGWRKWRIKVVIEGGWITYYVDSVRVKERPYGGEGLPHMQHVPGGRFECSYSYYDYDTPEQEQVECIYNTELRFVEAHERGIDGSGGTVAWREATHLIGVTQHKQLVKGLA